MKPLVLTMQAFGPFAERQTVDFTALGERALFLIHGPTGAGKTTLLDALCFALYGDTSGGERDPRAMRSDHAAPALPTEVSFTFALGEERYRVTRQPAQRRPKQRGAGHTEAPATAQLDRLDGDDWTSVATQPGKVTAAVESRLGFDSVQFRQVIVLPQGRFRELLSARSDQREAILQALFRTERYRELGDALKREARAVEEQAKTIATKRQAVLQQADAESTEALDERREQLDADRAALQPQERAARERAKAARERLESGRRAQAALKEAADAATAAVQVDSRRADIDRRRGEIDAARRAERVRPLDLALAEAQRSREAAAGRERDAQAELRAAAQARELAAAALAAEFAREPERAAAARRAAELAGLADQVARLAAAVERQQAAERQRVQLATEVKGLAVELERQRELSVERSRSVDALNQSATRVEALGLQIRLAESKREQLARLVDIRATAGRAEQALAAAVERAAAAEREFVAARAAREHVELRWVAGRAAQLAASLVADAPCPVCGSRDHPAPAHAEPGAEAAVDEPTLNAAREAAQRTEAARDAALRKRQEAEGPCVQARTRLADLEHALQDAPETADVVDTRLVRLRRELAEAEAAAGAAKALAEQVAQLKAAITRGETLFASRDAARVEAATQAAAAQGEVRLLHESVPEGLRSSAALRKAIETAEAQRKGLESAFETARRREQQAAARVAAAEAASKGAVGERARADEAFELAGERFVAALAAEGFPGDADYRAALRAQEVLRALERDVTDYDRAAAAAHDRLARARAAAEGLAAPDLVAFEGECTESATLLEGLLARLQQLSAQIGAVDRALVALAALAAEGQDVDARYAVLGRLAEVANGANPLRMTFQRFVLATLLDEVLEAASLRLTRMSRSRFELRRVVGVLDQRTAGGLELEVFDHFTGTARPANTLSGGEGFLASLSLALGLADVVQSRAGGIQMETLFIDEGFGTLDPESLDFALRTLIDLQQAGRLVGVISHVAELKERMDVRLEVRAGTRGSEILICR